MSNTNPITVLTPCIRPKNWQMVLDCSRDTLFCTKLANDMGRFERYSCEIKYGNCKQFDQISGKFCNCSWDKRDHFWRKNEIQLAQKYYIRQRAIRGLYCIEHAKKSPTRDLCICQKYDDYRVRFQPK